LYISEALGEIILDEDIGTGRLVVKPEWTPQ
jgi:hypothetical protein